MSGRQRLQVVMAAIMATTTVAMSVHGLAVIAGRGQAPVVSVLGHDFPLGALAFVLALDGVALIAAVGPRHEWPDVAVLVVAHAVSASLQYIAAPEDYWAKVVYTTPVVMTGVGVWLLVRSFQGAPVKKVTKVRSARIAAGATPPPPPATARGGVSAGGRSTPTPVEAGREGVRPATKLAAPPAVRHLAMVVIDGPDRELARAMSERLDPEPSRRNVQDVHEELYGSRPGSSRADRILSLVLKYRVERDATTSRGAGA